MYTRRNTTGKKDAAVCYMNAPLPYAIEENHGGCFFDDDDDLAQVLQDQVGYHFLFLRFTWLTMCSSCVLLMCYGKPNQT